MEKNYNADNQPATAAADDAAPVAGLSAAEAVRRPSFPSWYDFLVLALLFAVSQAVTGAVAMKLGYAPDLMTQAATPDSDLHAPSDDGMTVMARALAAGYAAGMSLMVFMTLVYRRLRGGRGRVARFSPRGFDPALLLGNLVTVLAANIVVEPLTELLPGTPDYNLLGRGGWALLSTVVCAPLFEEFLFRGVIMESVRRRRGVIAAWIVSSLCFGLAHGLPSAMAATGIIGLVLGYVCIRSGSLFGSIVLHGLNNALAMLLLILGYGDRSLRELTGEHTYWVIYAVAAAVFVWWLLRAVHTLAGLRRSEMQAERPL